MKRWTPSAAAERVEGGGAWPDRGEQERALAREVGEDEASSCRHLIKALQAQAQNLQSDGDHSGAVRRRGVQGGDGGGTGRGGV